MKKAHNATRGELTNLTITAGDVRMHEAEQVQATLTYEKHPAAGSFAFPGEAVIGRGRCGGFLVCHAVSNRGEEWVIHVDGPSELDPMTGGFFGLCAEGDSFEAALKALRADLVNIERWARAASLQ